MLELKSQSIDFVLAFPQAELEEELYMELPVGFEALGADCSQVLKLKKNLYGLKQASANWYEMIKGGLERRKFSPSIIDPCVFYKEGMIVLLYVDDMIVVSKKEEDIDKLIKSLKEEDERFILTSEGDIKNYLGVEIVKNKDGSFEFKQPYLIWRILHYMNVEKGSNKGKQTPVTLPLLHKDIKDKSRRYEWNYCVTNGMLNF